MFSFTDFLDWRNAVIGREYGRWGYFNVINFNSSEHISSFVSIFPNVPPLNLATLPQQKLLFINEKDISHYFSELELL